MKKVINFFEGKVHPQTKSWLHLWFDNTYSWQASFQFMIRQINGQTDTQTHGQEENNTCFNQQ